MRDIFFDLSKLSITDKINICTWAKDHSTIWWVDWLDCNISWARERINMSWDDIISKLNDPHHIVIINRKYNEPYLEIGFTTLTTPSYFLWIHCDEVYIDELITTFNLEKI